MLWASTRCPTLAHASRACPGDAPKIGIGSLNLLCGMKARLFRRAVPGPVSLPTVIETLALAEIDAGLATLPGVVRPLAVRALHRPVGLRGVEASCTDDEACAENAALRGFWGQLLSLAVVSNGSYTVYSPRLDSKSLSLSSSQASGCLPPQRGMCTCAQFP